MNDTTKKLSGPAKDRFLERFFAVEPDIDPALAEHLASRSKAAFSSVRVRRAVLGRTNLRRPPRTIGPASPHTGESPVASSQQPSTPIPSAPDRPAEVAFDPFEFGLVPVYQREGREGLLARLTTVSEVGHLQQMAKVQQIVLPHALRSGEGTADDIRSAIADAVAKRIADRRSAAG